MNTNNNINYEEILKFVISLIQKINTEVNDKIITISQDSVIDDFHWEEIDFTYLIVECEEHWDILLDDELIMKQKTVKDLAHYLEETINKIKKSSNIS